MHYYKRNLGDYAKKAGRLTMLQHGSYTLLMDACYDREQFPTMAEAIEWTWASSAAEVEAVEFVLHKFFMLEDGIYVQARIREELAEYQAKAETNKRIAVERETKRKQTSTNREPVVDESPPNHKPITTNHKPVTKKKSEDTSPTAPVDLLAGVDAQVAKDFKELRAKAKAPITATAMSEIVKQAELAGMTLEAALRVCCSRGWRGFKAEWVAPDRQGARVAPSRQAGFDQLDYNEGIEDGRIA